LKRILSVSLAAVPVLVLLTLAIRGVARGQEIATALPQTVDAPSDNTTSPAKVTLGRLLFWDPIISGTKDVACATCHHPDFGYAENLDISIGVNGVGLGNMRKFASPNSIPFVKRNSQSLLNTAFNGIDRDGHYNPSTAPMFWDIRVVGLEAQALEPIKTFEEMRGGAYSQEQALDSVAARLKTIPEYRTLFTKAFGNNQAISAESIGKALAAFERTLVANNSPFDRYMRGDSTAMTEAQIRGMAQFERVGCGNCHNGPMFSDYKLHVLGVPGNGKLQISDSGVNGTYAFRTASLRNLAFTAPYMHSGVFPTLQDVLNFYNRAGRGFRNGNFNGGQVDPLLRQLRGVNFASRDIIEFLGALNDASFDKTIPARVPSGLHPGGRIE
jgi:cytochrome c peroxidase